MNLVSAFEPFNGRARNRSLDTAEALEKLGPKDTSFVTLPVDFESLPASLESALEDRIDRIILLGESSHTLWIEFEQIALNRIYASIPDNKGVQIRDQEIGKGELALASTWPVDELLSSFQTFELRCRPSFHAGTYLCNMAFYLALSQSGAQSKCTFIHLPNRNFPWGPESDRVALALHTLLEI